MELIIATLGTYGITSIMVESDGPFRIFYRLRKLSWLSAFECFLCLSLWVAFLMSVLLADNITQLILYTAASSGGAILIHNYINRDI